MNKDAGACQRVQEPPRGSIGIKLQSVFVSDPPSRRRQMQTYRGTLRGKSRQACSRGRNNHGAHGLCSHPGRRGDVIPSEAQEADATLEDVTMTQVRTCLVQTRV